VTGAELKRPRTEESSEEQQQQQNGADRSNGSDFDQAYPDRNQEDDHPPEDQHSELIHQHQQHQQPSFQHPPSQDYQQPQYYNPQGDGITQSRRIDVPNSKVQQSCFTFMVLWLLAHIILFGTSC
jgi:hypothetical protein